MTLLRLGAAVALAAAAAAIGGARAQPKKPAAAPPQPAAIWPAGLEKLLGRYTFVQIASPGGLWERRRSPEGKEETRQVSLNELPAAFRQQLQNAEITLSDLKLPTAVEAEERESPTRRGKLRFYAERGEGRLTLRGLPGIGLAAGDPGQYSGRVELTLQHQSHSNPSVQGVLLQRFQQEPTWGAAALDFADLGATPLETEGRPADRDVSPVIANARVLRSGVEIFPFVQWREQTEAGERTIFGAVRLLAREKVARLFGEAVTR